VASTRRVAHPSGASRALTTNTARRQSSLKASIVLTMATSEPSRYTTRRIASDPLTERRIFRRARISIGREPFAEGKDVAAGFDHGKLAVLTAQRDGGAVGRDQHVGPGAL